VRIIKPDWPAPAKIVAFSTTRQGGCSKGNYRGLNVAQHVGDDSAVVSQNRRLLAQELPAGTSIQWLTQEHGCNVERAGKTGTAPVADATWTDAPAVACAVMTADCLPVLFCSEHGEKVAAAHAGWRGLAQGVLEACTAAMEADTRGIMAWLGPAIGPNSFEVGGEVREQFLSNSGLNQQHSVMQCFKELANRPGFYLADLYGLARIQLNAIGISRIYGGDLCTNSEASRFYSYRRDGETGRMATLIAITPS
jgi:YfiH family protein